MQSRAITSTSVSSGMTWSTVVGGGNVVLSFVDSQLRTWEITLTTAEAAALGTKLGGSGGAASNGTGP